jgi:hypothetical protein
LKVYTWRRLFEYSVFANSLEEAKTILRARYTRNDCKLLFANKPIVTEVKGIVVLDTKSVVWMTE